MKPTIYDLSWYERNYGPDWAEIVREEDIRLGRNSNGTYPKLTNAELREMERGNNSPSEHWASHPINNQ